MHVNIIIRSRIHALRSWCLPRLDVYTHACVHIPHIYTHKHIQQILALYTLHATGRFDHHAKMNSSSGFDDLKKIAAIRAGSGVICVLLGSVAFFINVAFKKYRFHVHLMVLYMSGAAVLYGSAAALNRVDYDSSHKDDATQRFCAADGFMNIYAGWTVLLSVFAVSCNVFMAIIERTYTGRRAQVFWLILIFVFPLLVTWLPFIKMEYGQSASWPWCSFPVNPNTTFSTVVRYGLVIVPYGLFITVQIAMYVAGVFIVIRRRKLCEQMHDPEAYAVIKKREKEAIMMGLYFGLVFLGYVLAFIAVLASQSRGTKSYGWVVFALWIVFGSFNPLSIGLTAFLITVDRTTCSAKSFFSLCGKNASVSTYPIDVAIDESTRAPEV